MKIAILKAAVLATSSSALSAETLSAIMQHAAFSSPDEEKRERYDHNNPYGQTSNNDSDHKRELPDFASPANKGKERPFEEAEHIEGDELLPIAVRNARAAIKDPVLAKMPQVKPYNGRMDMMEPIVPADYKKLSPVFLTDPFFTEGKAGGDGSQLFVDHNFGGHKRPVSPS